jgi:hypothetical protein
VALELVLELKSSSGAFIELDAGISRYSQGLPIRREGVVCNRVMEEMVDFRGGHDVYFLDRRSSLLSSIEVARTGLWRML